MGVDITETLTSFIKCRKSKITEDVEILFCKNKECSLFKKESGKAKFCSACGQKIEKSTKPIKIDKVDTCDLTSNQKLFHITFDQKFDYYLPNRTSRSEPSRMASIDAKACDSMILEIPVDLPSLHISWFTKEFAQDIKKVEEAYGKDNVSIHYGLIHHVS